jgi:hypothetical protein
MARLLTGGGDGCYLVGSALSAVPRDSSTVMSMPPRHRTSAGRRRSVEVLGDGAFVAAADRQPQLDQGLAAGPSLEAGEMSGPMGPSGGAAGTLSTQRRPTPLGGPNCRSGCLVRASVGAR